LQASAVIEQFWGFAGKSAVNRRMKIYERGGQSCRDKARKNTGREYAAGNDRNPSHNAKTSGWQSHPENGAHLSQAYLSRFKTFIRIELSLGL
jgi:hypothetical protein